MVIKRSGRMKKTSFYREWKEIFTNRQLLVAVIAILLVPLMYAGMFLWAFWDPYDYLDKLPVAVINEDEGADFEGKELRIGDDLVDNLKDLEELTFDFVDKDQGYADLEDQKYYLLVEIPKDFSENATTLMDDHPKKLMLKYIPNESFNFLSSQIGESAVKEIQAKIASEVTKTYAETMFDTIEEIGDGLATAADGSGELDEGVQKIKDGTGDLKEALTTLASKSIEFEEGVGRAADGTIQLAEGAQTLSSGLVQMQDATGKFVDASQQLGDGSQALGEGVQQVNGGLTQLEEKNPQLIAGTKQLQNGLTQFEQQLPAQMGQQIQQQLQSGLQSLDEGIDQLETGLTSGIQQGLTQKMAPALSAQLVDGVAKQVAAGVNAQLGNLPETIASQMAPQLAEGIVNQQQQAFAQLFNQMQALGIPAEQISALQQGVAEQSPSKEQVTQQLHSQIAQGLAGSGGAGVSEEQLKQQLQEPISSGVSQAAAMTAKEINENVATGMGQFKSGVHENMGGAEGIEQSIATAIAPVFKQLNGGALQISEGQQAMQQGIVSLAQGSSQLLEGSQALTYGHSQLIDNMNVFGTKVGEAANGAQQLATGASTLNDGMGQLADGSSQFNDASHQLKDGSTTLDDGVVELKEGTEELHSKLAEAADEVNDVSTTDETYDMMGSPVDMEKTEVNHVPNYGTGFAPYFISLGLFVGALLMSIVINLREPVGHPKNGFTLYATKTGMVAVIGIIQALILDAILLLGLGLEVTNVPLFILVTIMTSFVFMSLVQLLSTTLGDPGRFIAIVLLILQLTTSAGTFPLELIPAPLQPLNAFLPMTYSVQAFKAVVSSGDTAHMWANLGILGIFLVVTMALTLLYFIVHDKKMIRKSQQEA